MGIMRGTDLVTDSVNGRTRWTTRCVGWMDGRAGRWGVSRGGRLPVRLSAGRWPLLPARAHRYEVAGLRTASAPAAAPRLRAIGLLRGGDLRTGLGIG